MLLRAFTSLSELVGWHPDPLPTTEPEAERRVWLRHACDREAACQRIQDPDGFLISAKVRDISRGGINLLVSEAIDPGSLLTIELPGTNNQPGPAVLAYVIRVNSRGSGEWTLGCTFALELSDVDLEPFGIKPARPAQPDQRAWQRVPCDLKASYQLACAENDCHWPARVLDLSPRGIGLHVCQALPVGTLLSLHLLTRQEVERLNILASVAHSRRQADQAWMLGCTFIRELANHEMAGLLESAPAASPSAV